MKKRILTIILTVSILLTTIVAFTGCGNETETTTTLPTPTTPVEEKTEFDNSNVSNEETTNNETDIANSNIQFGYKEYDKKYEEYWELFGGSIGTTMLCFPSTKSSSPKTINEFYTKEEFLSYLDEYSDILEFDFDELKVEKEHFVCLYTTTTYDILNEGGENHYFLLSDPCFSPTKEIEVDTITVDKETKTAYVILKESENDFPATLYSEKVEAEINSTSKASYALCCVDISGRYLEEVGINYIYFVLPPSETSSNKAN
jgi:hypothetical protein